MTDPTIPDPDSPARGAEPVLAGMSVPHLTGNQSMAYEVAVEGLRLVIGQHTALLAQAQARPEPDPAAITARQAELQAWTDRYHALDPADATAVATTQQDCARELQRLRATGS